MGITSIRRRKRRAAEALSQGASAEVQAEDAGGETDEEREAREAAERDAAEAARHAAEEAAKQSTEAQDEAKTSNPDLTAEDLAKLAQDAELNRNSSKSDWAALAVKVHEGGHNLPFNPEEARRDDIADFFLGSK